MFLCAYRTGLSLTVSHYGPTIISLPQTTTDNDRHAQSDKGDAADRVALIILIRWLNIEHSGSMSIN